MTKDKNQRRLASNCACRAGRCRITQKSADCDPHVTELSAYDGGRTRGSVGRAGGTKRAERPKRRSRVLRVSAGRPEPPTSAAWPIQCSGGARIQSRCLHQIVGIAPNLLKSA